MFRLLPETFFSPPYPDGQNIPFAVPQKWKVEAVIFEFVEVWYVTNNLHIHDEHDLELAI